MTTIDEAVAAVDVDGAVCDAAQRVGGHTRAGFLLKAAAAGGGLMAGGAASGLVPDIASAHTPRPSRKEDLHIIEYALTLEYLEAAFYKEASSAGALSGDVLAYAKAVAQHERAHVDVLRGAIRKLYNRRPPFSPRFDFQGTTHDQVKFVATSFALENLGVRAYQGQAGHIDSRAVLLTAASILSVEGRHASAAALLLGRSPFAGTDSFSPYGAFDRGSGTGSVLSEVKSTHFITSK